jgi:signal transduction histidine kinase
VVAYRIVTEAVTNVIKHAGATRGDIDVATRDQELVILVSDDGGGLSADSRSPTDVRLGVGLSSIRSRVDEVGGEFVVVSGPAGTQLRATLPARGHSPENVMPAE